VAKRICQQLLSDAVLIVTKSVDQLPHSLVISDVYSLMMGPARWMGRISFMGICMNLFRNG